MCINKVLKYRHHFIRAATSTNIIGADFLSRFNLAVDLRNKRLIDMNNKQWISGLIKQCKQPSVFIINHNIELVFQVLNKQRSKNSPKQHNIEHHIDTGDHRPVVSRPRRLFGEKLKIAKEYFKKMVDSGVCKQSNSPWASPLHMVLKKNGEWRPCGDYRLLNQLTTTDAYPMKYLHDFVDTLSNCTMFSAIDIKSAYWSIPLSKQSAAKTAITTPFGLFEFKVMPFGLCNAAQTFQRFVDQLFRDIPSVFVYIDDILIASKTLHDHIAVLDQVLQVLSDNNLEINEKKCQFAQSEVEFLGFTVSAKGVEPIESKIKAVEEFPRPSDIKSIRRFLGMINFYRSCLPNISHTLVPLYEMKEDDLCWTEPRIKAFQNAKLALRNAVTISFPDSSVPFLLKTDASDVAIGASLEQNVNNVVRPLGFFSRKLSSTEHNYSPFDKELLAIREAVEHFIHLIEGHVVTVFTDHKPIVAAFTKPTNRSPRQSRHFAFIAEFVKEIKHIPGAKNIVADSFSRVSEISAISEEVLAEAQQLDPELDTFVQQQSHQIILSTTATGKRIINVLSDGRSRPFIPEPLRRTIFNSIHNLGHPSKKSTRRSIANRFFWPEMNKDVNLWAAECTECQQAKIHRHIKIPPIAINVPSERFSEINIDIVGPLPISKDGHRYVLTFIDRFSRWPEVAPLKSITAKDVALKIVETWISRFGVPHKITTDRGVQFEAALFKELLELLGTEHVKTVPYNPRANGLIERFHRTIKTALMTKKGDWLDNLPLILLSLRTTYSEDLHSSPAELVYGTELTIPGDLITDVPHTPTLPPNEVVTQLKSAMKNIRPVPTRLQTNIEEYIPQELEKATHVWLRRMVRTGLNTPYTGPYPVVEHRRRTIIIKTSDGNREVSLEQVKPAKIQRNVTFNIPRGRGRPKMD